MSTSRSATRCSRSTVRGNAMYPLVRLGQLASFNDLDDSHLADNAEPGRARGRVVDQRAYADRNAPSGSTLLARPAGIQTASSAMTTSNNGTPMNTRGSRTSTPNNMLFM